MTLKNIVDTLHAYAYGRWTGTVIGLMRKHIIPRLSIRGKEKFADGFHFKALTNEQARAIISVNQDIPRLDLEQITHTPRPAHSCLRRRSTSSRTNVHTATPEQITAIPPRCA
jgi:hypothetical protein